MRLCLENNPNCSRIHRVFLFTSTVQSPRMNCGYLLFLGFSSFSTATPCQIQTHMMFILHGVDTITLAALIRCELHPTERTLVATFLPRSCSRVFEFYSSIAILSIAKAGHHIVPQQEQGFYS
jgi:hypothetical protein